MDNTNRDMGFLEMVVFDVLIVCFYLAFLLTAVFFTENNLFLIDLSLVFGALTIPVAGYFGRWWAYLRYHERAKLVYEMGVRESAARWLCFDFGLKGDVWFFRALSSLIVVFAVYDLIGYIIG